MAPSYAQDCDRDINHNNNNGNALRSSDSHENAWRAHGLFSSQESASDSMSYPSPAQPSDPASSPGSSQNGILKSARGTRRGTTVSFLDEVKAELFGPVEEVDESVSMEAPVHAKDRDWRNATRTPPPPPATTTQGQAGFWSPARQTDTPVYQQRHDQYRAVHDNHVWDSSLDRARVPQAPLAASPDERAWHPQATYRALLHESAMLDSPSSPLWPGSSSASTTSAQVSPPALARHNTNGPLKGPLTRMGDPLSNMSDPRSALSSASSRRTTRFTDFRSPEEKARQEQAAASATAAGVITPADKRLARRGSFLSVSSTQSPTPATTPRRQGEIGSARRAPLAHIRSALLAEKSPARQVAVQASPGGPSVQEEGVDGYGWPGFSPARHQAARARFGASTSRRPATPVPDEVQAQAQARPQTHGYASPPLSRQTTPSRYQALALQRRASDGTLHQASTWSPRSGVSDGGSQGHARTRSDVSTESYSFRAAPRTKLMRTVDDMTKELQYTREGMANLATRLEQLEQGRTQTRERLWQAFERQLDMGVLAEHVFEERVETRREVLQRWLRQMPFLLLSAAAGLALIFIAEWMAVRFIRQPSGHAHCLPS